MGYRLNVPDIHNTVHIMTISITQRRDQDRTMSASYVRSLNVPDIVCVYLFLFIVLFIQS